MNIIVAVGDRWIKRQRTTKNCSRKWESTQDDDDAPLSPQILCTSRQPPWFVYPQQRLKVSGESLPCCCTRPSPYIDQCLLPRQPRKALRPSLGTEEEEDGSLLLSQIMDEDEDTRPTPSYKELIIEAIESVPEKRLKLSEIYQVIKYHYPLHDCFIKLPLKQTSASGVVGHYWTINRDVEEKQTSTRKRNRASGTKHTKSCPSSKNPNYISQNLKVKTVRVLTGHGSKHLLLADLLSTNSTGATTSTAAPLQSRPLNGLLAASQTGATAGIEAISDLLSLSMHGGNVAGELQRLQLINLYMYQQGLLQQIVLDNSNANNNGIFGLNAQPPVEIAAPQPSSATHQEDKVKFHFSPNFSLQIKQPTS
uniref:Fork-head domain-containing protein n=1 Tax=Ditylenchus dipsaci TaxID=166011 RepID=A0A915CMH2_9BILA